MAHSMESSTISADKTNETPMHLNESINSPTLINTTDTSRNEAFEIAANVTVENNTHKDSYGSSFSSIENTFRSLSGEDSLDTFENIEELEINNTVLKAMLLNILERVDNMEIIIKSHSDSLEAVKNENKILKEKCDNAIKTKKSLNLNNDLEDLKDTIFDLECRTIQNEQYSRRESLLISGIPETVEQKELERTVLKILKSIGISA